MSLPEEKFLIALSRLRNYLFRDLENLLRNHSLTTTQFAVLEVLYQKGDLCVKEIQERVLGTNGNIPLVIKNLERNGLVFRKKKSDDARFSIIKLTAAGQAKMQTAYPEQQQRLQDLLKNYEAKRLADLTRNLFSLFNAVTASTHEKEKSASLSPAQKEEARINFH